MPLCQLLQRPDLQHVAVSISFSKPRVQLSAHLILEFRHLPLHTLHFRPQLVLLLERLDIFFLLLGFFLAQNGGAGARVLDPFEETFVGSVPDGDPFGVFFLATNPACPDQLLCPRD